MSGRRRFSPTTGMKKRKGERIGEGGEGFTVLISSHGVGKHGMGSAWYGCRSAWYGMRIVSHGIVPHGMILHGTAWLDMYRVSSDNHYCCPLACYISHRYITSILPRHSPYHLSHDPPLKDTILQISVCH